MDEWPNVFGGQVGISAFARTAGHLLSSLHPASAYPASRTFKGQNGSQGQPKRLPSAGHATGPSPEGS